MKPILFSGSSHPALAAEIAKRANLGLGKIEIKEFACREIYVKIKEAVRGKVTFVLQTCTEMVNRDFMETFLILDALKRHDAHEIHVVMPHFGYSRQDRIAEKGETISAKLMASLLSSSGMDSFITMDLHSPQIQGFFDVPISSVRARPLIVAYFKKKNIKEVVVVTTDSGGVKIATSFAHDLNAPLVVLHKSRMRHNNSEVTHLVGNVKNKTALIFDDMIDTAGSMVNAKEVVLKNGANKGVYAAATHALFSAPACMRLNKAGFKEIVVTDTIPLSPNRTPKNVKVISVAPLLVSAIKQALH